MTIDSHVVSTARNNLFTNLAETLFVEENIVKQSGQMKCGSVGGLQAN